MSVLPPGRTLGTSFMTVVLANPRLEGMASNTSEPFEKVIKAIRSLAASKELMKDREASLTAAHLEPIEPDTSSTRERSTIRRVASPVLVTCTWLKLPSFMKVVGSISVAVTVTTLTPVTASVVDLKKLAAAVASTAVVPIYPMGKLALNMMVASVLGLPLLR